MAFDKIKESDYSNKGIRVKNNPLGLSVSEAQRAFDELSLDVIIPKHNALVDGLNNLNIDKRVPSDNIKGIRLNSDKVIEVTTDGKTYEATGSSGHIILDSSGKQMTQRSRMQFKNGVVSDENGITTITALKGDKGDKGDRGPQGIQGVQGIQGKQGFVIVPSVDSLGVMSFSIQETAIAPSSVNIRGPQGPQGLQGIQGVQGVTGPQGEQGPAGVQGIQGKQGPQGVKGEKGDTGEQGIQGIQGIRGEKGEKGDTGEQGLRGVQGPQGPQGIQGNDGADGRSFVIQDIYPTLGELKKSFPTGNEYAYQVSADKNIYIWSERETDWVSLGQLQGPMGPQGIQGVQGIQGEKGEKGEKGDTGEQGIQGIQGIRGEKGEKGDTGEQGIQGIQGIQGVQGVTGPQGEQGIQGVKGADGKSAYTAATEAGYAGTEETFYTDLATVSKTKEIAEAALPLSGGTMNGDIITSQYIKYLETSGSEKGNLRTFLQMWGSDSGSLSAINNVNIGSWQGISFVPTIDIESALKNGCKLGVPSVNINVRNGNISFRGDLLKADGTNYVSSITAKTTSNQNLLRNPDFQIWQRGTTFSQTANTNKYTADGWISGFVNDGKTHTIKKQTNGSIYVDPNGGYMKLRQVVEIPDSIRGETVTLQACLSGANTDETNTDFQMGYGNYNNGTWGTPTINAKTVNYNEEQIFTCNFTLPTTGYPYIEFYFFRTGTANIRWTKLELGEFGSQFVPRPYAEELALCQRYFYNLNLLTTGAPSLGNGMMRTTTVCHTTLYLPTALRTNTPTITTTGTWQALIDSSNIEITAITKHQCTGTEMVLMHTLKTANTIGKNVFVQGLNNSGANLTLDAEFY